MFDHSQITGLTKEEFYENLVLRVKGITYEEHDMIANLANVASILFNNMDEVNWAGFYLYKEDQLVLGPFHGNPACIRIPMGKGVCGAAASECKTQLVKDVHAFPGHIACDGATKSEVVIPIMVQGELKGVLDIDSPVTNRFDEEDQKWLEEIVAHLVESCHWDA